MNRIIPHRIPCETFVECEPWKVLSRMISRHHWIIVKVLIIKPKIISSGEKMWNHFTMPVTMIIEPMAPVRGHGLGVTRWYG